MIGILRILLWFCCISAAGLGLYAYDTEVLLKQRKQTQHSQSAKKNSGRYPAYSERH